MQKAKKLLCLALSLFMLLMMFPAGVLAANTTEDDTQAANGKACRIGTTYYDSLPAALVAVQDGDTITLIQDVTTGNLAIESLSGIALTIDGNGHKWTLDTSAYTNIEKNNVTIQNFEELTIGKAFNLKTEGGKLTFKDCKITAKSFFVRMAYNKTGAEVNLDNCTVVSTAADTGMLLTTESCGTINIHNTTITTTVGASAEHAGNNSLFNATDNYALTINVTGNSKLVGASSSTSSFCGIIQTSGKDAKYNVTMNMESTTTLRLAGTGYHKVNNSFTCDKGGRAIINGIPKLEISAEMARQGVWLPTIYNDGKVAREYVPSSVGTMMGNYYRNETAENDVTFAPVWTSNTQDAKVADGYICKIGDVYFKTLNEAVSAAADNDVITLIDNFNMSSFSLSGTGKTFTIDGVSKYTFSRAGDGYSDLGNNNITFKNMTISQAKGFRSNSGSDIKVKFENCNLYFTNGIGFRVHGSDTYEFVNTVVLGSQTDTMFLINDGNSAVSTQTVIVKDSYIENLRGIGGGHVGNHSIFNYAGSGDTGILEVKGNSVLSSYVRNNKANVAAIITTYGANLTVNMESTIELRQASAYISGAMYFYKSSGSITMNGTPKYTATALALNTGVKLPTLENGDKTLLGVTVGGKLYKAEGTTTVTGLDTGLYTIDPVWVSADTIKTLTGASIRTAAPNGIRFETEISEELIRLLGDNVTFGTLIAPKKYVDDVTKRNGSFVLKDMYDGEYILVPQTKWAADGKTFYAALTGIPDTKEAYEMEFAGRGYYTVTYADGSQVTFYSEFSATDNVRSLYTVAKAAVADGVTDNAMINHIIAVVEGAS